MRRRWTIIVVLAFVGLVALFSACTLFVSHERESITRAAEGGSTAARVFIAGANFWDRYFVFLIIMFVNLGFFGQRIAARLGWW